MGQVTENALVTILCATIQTKVPAHKNVPVVEQPQLPQPPPPVPVRQESPKPAIRRELRVYPASALAQPVALPDLIMTVINQTASQRPRDVVRVVALPAHQRPLLQLAEARTHAQQRTVLGTFPAVKVVAMILPQASPAAAMAVRSKSSMSIRWIPD